MGRYASVTQVKESLYVDILHYSNLIVQMFTLHMLQKFFSS